MHKIGFIGAGNMAGAIIRGVISGGAVAPQEAAVCDVDSEKTRPFADMGLKVFGSAAELVKNCKYIMLAVKPQVMDEVLSGIAPQVTCEHVLISIAAGISHGYIRKKIGFDCKVVPVMPNTPLLVGHGATAIARVEPISDEEFEFAAGLFKAGGAVEVIPGNKLAEIIPVNGSAPAFIYLFARHISDYAEAAGIDRGVAERLFCHTLIGSAKMMLESGKTQDELIDMVCSPGGTTIKAIEALNQNGFKEAIYACCDACVKRAHELGR